MKIKLFLLLLMVSSAAVHAQESSIGLRIGYNYSIFSSSVNTTTTGSNGIHTGIYFEFKPSRRLHIQPEIIYSQQGEKEKSNTKDVTVNVDYINIPLVFKIYFGKAFNLQLGPQVGIMAAGRIKGTMYNLPVDTNILKESSSVKQTDFAALLGVGLDLGKHFNLGMRNTIGLTSVFSPPDGSPSDYPKQCNNTFVIFAGVKIL